MIANQIGQQCDPKSHWWGLEWNPALFDFESMTAEEEKKCWLDFQTAQNAIMDVLSSNFASNYLFLMPCKIWLILQGIRNR